MRFYRTKKDGYMLIQVLVFAAIAVYILSALVGWSIINIKASKEISNKEQAFQIAEGGIDYYRWHLAHAPVDYQDGTGVAGPYVHNFYDKDGNIIGTFTLNVTPPPLGSTLVVIKSTGKVLADPNISRTIQTQLAKPSIAKYAVAANSAMRFGEGTVTFGPIHSNGGVRFDGLAHNIVSSGLAGYDDPDHTGLNEFGVHTHVNPPPGSGVNDNFRPAEAPPSAVSSRPDVFEVGRQFPLPLVDFTGITADLAQMKTSAQSSGFYRGASGSLGYHLILKTNDTFDFYKITRFTSAPSGCSDSSTDWGTWSINRQTLIGNYTFPANGIIFLEDNVWVDGQIDGARLTILAATLPDNAATRKNITINSNLLYTRYDGTDVLGLIAQNNINVGMVSDDNLRIDAAVIAQNGRVGRYYYNSSCSPYSVRSTITLWGMIATNLRYGFAYTNGTGYQTRNINYDASLLYGPPPNFPLTSDQYITLTWQEILK